MESEGKLGPAIFSSWADEVEKEDEEEARAQLQQKEKPNPFGSARPREVLQERGIDWRKLDLHLEQQASLVRREPLSEKYRRNIPISSFSAINRGHSELPRQGLKDANLGFNSASSNQIITVPPLRYPPRNIVASMSNSRISDINLHDLGSGQHGFKHRNKSKPEKDYTSGRNGVQMVHCREQRLHIEQGRHFKKNGIKFESGQLLRKNRNLPKSLAQINEQHSGFDHPGRKFDGNGRNMMPSLLGRPPVRDRMRLSPAERSGKSFKDDPAVREATEFHKTNQSRTGCGNIEYNILSQ